MTCGGMMSVYRYHAFKKIMMYQPPFLILHVIMHDSYRITLFLFRVTFCRFRLQHCPSPGVCLQLSQ